MSDEHWYPSKVPEWHKKKLREQGWRLCPPDEECGHCGRLVQYGGELCCGHHLSDNKLLAREDDGSLYYPYPTKKELYERIEKAEAAFAEIRRLCREEEASNPNRDIGWSPSIETATLRVVIDEF
jgi:hypothetical protein